LSGFLVDDKIQSWKISCNFHLKGQSHGTLYFSYWDAL
jgi:hypothetical protein